MAVANRPNDHAMLPTGPVHSGLAGPLATSAAPTHPCPACSSPNSHLQASPFQWRLLSVFQCQLEPLAGWWQSQGTSQREPLGTWVMWWSPHCGRAGRWGRGFVSRQLGGQGEMRALLNELADSSAAETLLCALSTCCRMAIVTATAKAAETAAVAAAAAVVHVKATFKASQAWKLPTAALADWLSVGNHAKRRGTRRKCTPSEPVYNAPCGTHGTAPQPCRSSPTRTESPASQPAGRKRAHPLLVELQDVVPVEGEGLGKGLGGVVLVSLDCGGVVEGRTGGVGFGLWVCVWVLVCVFI